MTSKTALHQAQGKHAGQTPDNDPHGGGIPPHALGLDDGHMPAAVLVAADSIASIVRDLAVSLARQDGVLVRRRRHDGRVGRYWRGARRVSTAGAASVRVATSLGVEAVWLVIVARPCVMVTAELAPPFERVVGTVLTGGSLVPRARGIGGEHRPMAYPLDGLVDVGVSLCVCGQRPREEEEGGEQDGGPPPRQCVG